MKYELIVKPSAEREIERLPSAIRGRILKKLDQIQDDPRGASSVKLSGSVITYRARAGDWRIVYEIADEKRIIYVTIVGHRGDVYRRI